MPEGSKRCPGCSKVKLRSEFSKQRSRKDGLDPYCEACRSERRATEREWRREYNLA